MRNENLPRLELDGFEYPLGAGTAREDTPVAAGVSAGTSGWRGTAAKIAGKARGLADRAGIRFSREKTSGTDEIDVSYKRLLVKTGICAALAIAILVISAVVSPGDTTQATTQPQNAVGKEFDIDDDIGKLKFVENLDDGTQSVMSVLPDTAAVLPSDGAVLTAFGQSGSSGVRFGPDGQTAYGIARGTVTAVGAIGEQGYVKMQLDSGETVLYCNIEPAVQMADIVQPGQVVGTLSGDYLYVEMKSGEEYVDPIAYISEQADGAQ